MEEGRVSGILNRPSHVHKGKGSFKRKYSAIAIAKGVLEAALSCLPPVQCYL